MGTVAGANVRSEIFREPGFTTSGLHGVFFIIGKGGNELLLQAMMRCPTGGMFKATGAGARRDAFMPPDLWHHPARLPVTIPVRSTRLKASSATAAADAPLADIGQRRRQVRQINAGICGSVTEPAAP